MRVKATLTEIRRDGMQKWERGDIDKNDHRRYIWLSPRFGSKHDVKVGDVATLEYIRGTGGAVGGHWAGWRLV